MSSELEKLRIEKHHKARRDERARWPLGLLLILLIGGVGVVMFQWRNAAAAPVVQTVRVRPIEMTDATKQPPQQQADLVVLNATGYIVAAHKIELASKVIGRVAWVGVEMGDKVKKDQVLVQLEDDEYKAHVDQCKAQLETAKAKLLQTESDWKRAQKIGAGDAMAQASYDEYKADYEMAKASVDAAQAQLDLAALDLKNTTIRSPIDATILARNVEVGEFVTTGFVGDRGAKGFVVSIADLNDLRVELDISQNDFAKVGGKQPCWVVTDAYPDRKYDAAVDLISPEANRQKATVLVRVKILKPDDALKPDMNATVSFLAPPSATGPTTGPVSGGKAMIRIPASALHEGSVYIVENGKAVQQPVTIGQKSATGEVEIRTGLIGGEDLVVSPPATLKNGDPVKVQNEPDKS